MRKLSVITNYENEWHINRLVEAGKRKGIEVEVVNVKGVNQIAEDLNSLGEVVLYRSSRLNNKVERPIFLERLANSGRVLINKAIFERPLVAHKAYQQKIIEGLPTVAGIQSFVVSSMDELNELVQKGELRFPLIVKANVGARGQKVQLVKSESEIMIEGKINDYVFQNFIRNEGDYRALVIGGRVIGVMKRVRSGEDEFRNNVSLGGNAIVENDPEVLIPVGRLALKVTSVFGLQMAGVDIIYDEEEEVYRFLEVNTVPQWKGFNEATGIDVAEKIIDYVLGLLARKEKPVEELVFANYDQNFEELMGKNFYYASRMKLWLSREIDEKRVSTLKERFLTAGYSTTREWFAEKLNASNEWDISESKLIGKKYRAEYYEKYPLLRKVKQALFKVAFAKVIYDVDLREDLLSVVSLEEIRGLWKELIEDKEAIKYLATGAINFFYNVEFLWNEEGFNLRPEEWLELAREMDEEDLEVRRLKVYLLTHCVIGESRFYARKIERKREVYVRMVEEVERIIQNNFIEISLDNKFEFLVCAELVGYESSLREMILMEASNSLSELGNYLIDRFNVHRGKKLGDDILSAAHRNTLFLMACNRKN